MMVHDIQLIRNEMIALLDRLAEVLSSVKEKRVFFINNYDTVLSVFHDRGILCEEVQRFEDLLMHQRELFAEDLIRNSFPRLLQFVLKVRSTDATAIATAAYST